MEERVFVLTVEASGEVTRPAKSASELRWYYGPTDWDANPGAMWHVDCPAGRGEVMHDKDGGSRCMGCGADQPPELDESPEREEMTDG